MRLPPLVARAADHQGQLGLSPLHAANARAHDEGIAQPGQPVNTKLTQRPKAFDKGRGVETPAYNHGVALRRTNALPCRTATSDIRRVLQSTTRLLLGPGLAAAGRLPLDKPRLQLFAEEKSNNPADQQQSSLRDIHAEPPECPTARAAAAVVRSDGRVYASIISNSFISSRTSYDRATSPDGREPGHLPSLALMFITRSAHLAPRPGARWADRAAQGLRAFACSSFDFRKTGLNRM